MDETRPIPEEWLGEVMKKWQSLIKAHPELAFAFETRSEKRDIQPIARDRKGKVVAVESINEDDFHDVEKVCQKMDRFAIQIRKMKTVKTEGSSA